jgi:hypothetical protein
MTFAGEAREVYPMTLRGPHGLTHWVTEVCSVVGC